MRPILHGPMRMLCAFQSNKKTLKHTLLTLFSVFILHFTYAQGTMGRWEMCGLSNTPTSVSPTGVATGVTFSTLTRGQGLTGASASNAFNATGWSTSTSLSTSNNDYYEFTITPDEGYSISMSAIKIREQMSNTSFDVFLRSSIDNYSSNISTWTAPTTATNRSINVSGVSGLQNRTTPVTFRIYGTDAANANSTYRLLCQGTGAGNHRGVDIDGSVTRTPYAAKITAINAGAATWCQGETRNVTVTVKNIGSATWHSADPMNIGLKWNEDIDYGNSPNFIPRVPTGTVAPGQTVIYTFPNVAASVNTGNNNLIADVVREGICWFGNNNGGCGPGNSTFTSTAISVVVTPAPVNVSGGGTFCNSTTITATGGAGGTIYFQGITSNGTSTATAASSRTITESGTYYFRARSAGGCWGTEGSVTVTINTTPSISVQAQSQSLCVGGNINLSVTATGTPAPTYQWSKNDVNISGETNASLSITNANVNDGGTYKVTVTNTCGSVSSSANVVVNTVPVITLDPQGQTVCAGQGAAFSVTATGSNLTYQWRKGGVNIGGQTSSTFNLSNVTVADAGNYDVVVSSAGCASTTSGSATLVVNSRPTASITTAASTKCSGTTSQISGNVVASGAWTLTLSDGQSTSGTVNGAFSFTVAPTSTTTYTLTSLSDANCNSISADLSGSTTITVNPLPTAVEITPSVATICNGGSVELVAGSTNGETASINVNNNFSTGVTVTGTSTGNRSQVFEREISGSNINSTGTYTSSNGGGILLAIAGATATGFPSANASSSVNTSAVLSVSTVGLTSLNLTFNHTYAQANGGGSGVVAVSTNGVDWADVRTYNSNQGGQTNFVAQSISLGSEYLNQTNLRIRFTYVATASSTGFITTAHAYWWAIDDVAINGGLMSLYSWSANTTSDVNGLPAGASTPGTDNVSITVDPSVTTTYTLTATNPVTNCNASTTSVVDVNARPTAVLSGGAVYCNGDNTTTELLLTVTGSGTISGTLSDGTAFSGTAPAISVNVAPAATTTYTLATLQDANCTAITADMSGSAEVVVNTRPTAVLSGSTSYCNGDDYTTTLILTVTGSGTISGTLSDGTSFSGTAPTINVDVTPVATTTYTIASMQDALCVSQASDLTGDATIVINPLIPVSVTITSSDEDNEICNGESVTFTATPVNGGNASYQWLLNDAPVGSNQSTFTTTTLANGDVVKVVLTSDVAPCAITNPATSNAIQSVVYPLLPVSVSVSSSDVDNTICQGETVVFTATGVNEGSAPSYQWFVNNIPVGSNQNTYSTDALMNGDVVTVQLTSNITPCAVDNPAMSSPVTMIVNDLQPVSVTLTASDEAVCAGTLVTFTATPVNGGDAPVYQWFVNDVEVIDVTGDTYASSTLQDNDVVKVILTSNITPCARLNPANSNAITMNIGEIPGTPGTITGPLNVCENVNTGITITYSIDPVADATSYTWVVPVGTTLVSGQGTTSINVLIHDNFALTSSQFKVHSNNDFVCKSIQSKLVVLKTVPGIPSTIYGSTNVCDYVGQAITVPYSIDPVVNATGYTWIVSANMEIVSGQGSTSIQVRYLDGFVRGSVKVAANSGCGERAPKSMNITASKPSAPELISGPVNPCQIMSESGVATYSITPVEGATSYTWTLPSGCTLVSGQGTNSIRVTFNNFPSGKIKVRSISNCGISGERSLDLVTSNIYVPGSISGPTNVCSYKATAQVQGTPVIYTIRKVNSALSYNWVAPANATIIEHPGGAGVNDTSVVVMFSSSFTEGLISVNSVSTCGVSATRSLQITTLQPRAPGVVTVVELGSCPDRLYQYSIPAHANEILWTVPAGGTIVSGQGTTSIVVSYAAGVISGQVTAMAVTNCGNSSVRKLSVKLTECYQSKFVQTPVKEMETAFDFTVYPSPFNVATKVKISGSKQKVEVRVLDMRGKVRSVHQTFTNAEVEIGSKLEPGIYIVEVNNGKQRLTKKVIKL